ncbi:MAG: hypothetical protein ACFE9R_09805, partial [Candidatus Hermodarchaeota archaeon]
MTEEDPTEIEEEKDVKPREKARATPTKKKKVSKAKAKIPEAPAIPEKLVHKKLKVNFWRTGLHDEEIGIHQSLKYQAKTRWFSKNFDIEGIIEVDDKKENIIAFNKEQWQESPLEEKRLVCRFFTIMEESMESRPSAG